ncbi:hypothetical protein PINS_up011684 [Pythium insidiosum]|nr:hypothetical protein PINS_up011684 [Pythium insidiosum]
MNCSRKPEAGYVVRPLGRNRTQGQVNSSPPSNPAPASTDDVVPRLYKPGKWDIWALGITIVIGGQYFSWNQGFQAGLSSYFIAFLLISSAYITLCLCQSEVTGALPFAGSSYGLSRCTLGFFSGFLIGCCDALEYITYVATSVVSFVNMCVVVVPAFEGYEPLVALLFYVSALALHIRGDCAFWYFNAVVAVISVVLLLVCVFGSLPHVSISKFGHLDAEQIDAKGFSGFMKMLPLACWFYVGVEAIGLASGDVQKPKTEVPFGQISCVLTLFMTGIMVFFVTVSLPPGIATLADDTIPFNRGFTIMFGITQEVATVLTLPATYATAFGFMWAYGKLIAAMASSRLLPPVLARVSKRCGTPVAGMVFGSTLSYAMYLLCYWVPVVAPKLFNVCIVCAFVSYMGQCIGYISLRRSYRNIKSSSSRNPLGVPSAIFSFCVWLMGLISVVGFQGDVVFEFVVIGGIIALLSAFYYLYARKRQTFSDQENRVLIVAHIIKFNKLRNSRHPHSSSQASRTKLTLGTNTSQLQGSLKSHRSVGQVAAEN